MPWPDARVAAVGNFAHKKKLLDDRASFIRAALALSLLMGTTRARTLRMHFVVTFVLRCETLPRVSAVIVEVKRACAPVHSNTVQRLNTESYAQLLIIRTCTRALALCKQRAGGQTGDTALEHTHTRQTSLP